jgi:hypothetical protein
MVLKPPSRLVKFFLISLVLTRELVYPECYYSKIERKIFLYPTYSCLILRSLWNVSRKPGLFNFYEFYCRWI